MAKTVNVQPKTLSVQAIIDQLRGQIAQRAWQIAAERGYETGRELEDWLTAESQLVWKPELRLEEREDAFVAKFRLPEVQPHDLQIYVAAQSIVILGEAKSEEVVEDVLVHGNEFRYGQIYREVSLPVPIDPDQAKARLSDGVLTVSLPKPKQELKRKPLKTSAQRKKTSAGESKKG